MAKVEGIFASHFERIMEEYRTITGDETPISGYSQLKNITLPTITLISELISLEKDYKERSELIQTLALQKNQGMSHCIALRCIAFCCIALYFIALHCIDLWLARDNLVGIPDPLASLFGQRPR